MNQKKSSPVLTGNRCPLSIRAILAVVVVSSHLGCQSGSQSPNAVRDLLVDRIQWKPYPTADSATPTNQHQFAITNTSARTSYRRVQLCFEYRTPTGQRLGSDTSVVDTLIEPGTLIKITDQRIGKLRPGTQRVDIRVLRATAN